VDAPPGFGQDLKGVCQTRGVRSEQPRVAQINSLSKSYDGPALTNWYRQPPLVGCRKDADATGRTSAPTTWLQRTAGWRVNASDRRQGGRRGRRRPLPARMARRDHDC